jgi:hypothetical protein
MQALPPGWMVLLKFFCLGVCFPVTNCMLVVPLLQLNRPVLLAQSCRRPFFGSNRIVYRDYRGCGQRSFGSAGGVGPRFVGEKLGNGASRDRTKGNTMTLLQKLQSDSDDKDVEDKDTIIQSAANDVLFKYIESNQLSSPMEGFGRLLDAGTGSHSLRWIASLIHREDVSLEDYTAITADQQMRQTVLKDAQKLQIEDCGKVLIGNWATTETETEDGTDAKNPESDVVAKEIIIESDTMLCKGQLYDTILADYLIG